MRHALEMLRVNPDPEDKNYIKLMAMKERAAAMVLSIQARVDDAPLRRQGGDEIGAILERIKGG